MREGDEDVRLAREERASRYALRSAILRDLFPRQREVTQHPNKRKGLCCGRRSGKTTLFGDMLGEELVAAGPDEGVFYGGLTKGLARKQIFPVLHGINNLHELGWEFREHTAEIRNPRGGILSVVGLEKISDIEKFRGFKSRRVILDEVQSYASKLEELITRDIEPTLGDMDGDLLLGGTPGKVPIGYWHSVATGKTGFQPFHWNVLENPTFREGKGQQWLDEILERFGWQPDNATFMQEYLGLWALDTRAIAFDFDVTKNTCELPADYSRQWKHVIGLDFGYSPDPTAWVVLAQRPHSNHVYIVHVETREKQLGDEIALRTKELIEGYGATRVAADSADPRLIDEFNRRYGSVTKVYVEQAYKLGKSAQIQGLNTEFRTRRLWCVAEACDDLIAELVSVQWEDDEHTELDPAQPNDCCDALQYGYSVINPQWVKEAPPPDPRFAGMDEVRAEAMKAMERARKERQRQAREGREPWDR